MQPALFFTIPLLACLQLSAQNTTKTALADRLDDGSDQWLMQAFAAQRADLISQDACAFRYEGAAPLSERSCESWVKTKAMCDLLFPLIKAKTSAREMDGNYAFLALLASGLNMHATETPGRAGIWQLTFPVAIKYGLTINDVLDERLAPDRATDAALDYLQSLEARFPRQPDRVRLAFLTSVPYVERFGDQLPQEDRELLAQIDALQTWYRGCPRKGFLLDVIAILNAHENVGFEQVVSFQTLHEALKVPLSTLEGANPAFVGTRVPGRYRDMPFILPTEAVTRMEALGDSLYSWEARKQAEEARRKAEAAKKRQPPAGSAVTYTVRSGDVLGKIAERHGVRVSEIKAWNNLRSDRINVGQKLVLYPGGKTAQTPKPKPQNPAPKPTQNTTTGSTYTVKSGDSLWRIARQFPGVSAEDIQRHNGITTDIKPGQVLRIPKAGG